MSDISNEPDDTQSFIRLLLHSDQYNITALVATTSYWLNSTTTPDEILKLTSAYGKVVANLNLHSEGTFPTEEYLSSICHQLQRSRQCTDQERAEFPRHHMAVATAVAPTSGI